MKSYKIIRLLTYIISTYCFLPSFYFRKISPCVKRRFNNSKNIFLTFDDGPNATYTLEILDLLKKYEVKATFFVVAKKAKENKTIVSRMIKDGHTLGLHSYSHKNAWLRTPWQTKLDFQQSIEIFKELDYQIKYYRAPWGIFNPFTYYYSNKFGLKSILWTNLTNDWNPNAKVDKIVDNIFDNLQGGDIIVFHDSNHNSDSDNGAPKNTIQVLDIILPALIKKGFHFQTLDKGMGNHVNEQTSLSGISI